MKEHDIVLVPLKDKRHDESTNAVVLIVNREGNLEGRWGPKGNYVPAKMFLDIGGQIIGNLADAPKGHPAQHAQWIKLMIEKATGDPDIKFGGIF